jgi:hemoglobin-like flavoprotein
MNAQQIQLVQETFEHVRPIAGVAADLFYNRLFELDPRLRPMFKGEMSEQKRKLMGALALVVAGLNDPEQILGAVRQLGKRHAAYGVQAGHYETVGVALLWTLGQGLGERFTPAVADAWAAAYGLVAATMQEAAYAAEPALA